MAITRVLRRLLVTLIVSCLVYGCMLFGMEPDDIIPGRGTDSPLAKKLARSPEGFFSNDGRDGDIRGRRDVYYSGRNREYLEHREHLEYLAAKKPLRTIKASTKGWKRSKTRPSFARVYVGDGNSLELKRMRITVTIEGARARTVVDHVFANPHGKVIGQVLRKY